MAVIATRSVRVSRRPRRNQRAPRISPSHASPLRVPGSGLRIRARAFRWFYFHERILVIGSFFGTSLLENLGELFRQRRDVLVRIPPPKRNDVMVQSRLICRVVFVGASGLFD